MVSALACSHPQEWRESNSHLLGPGEASLLQPWLSSFSLSGDNTAWPYVAGTSQPTQGPELLSQASSFHLLACRQRKTSEEGGERRERLQTHLVLIASATTKQLMAGKRRRNRALGERKGCSKQGETIYSFPKERGTIYSRSCSCGGLTHCIQLLSHCTRTRNMACFVL